MLLHQIIQQCMQHQDTVIAFHPTSAPAVVAIQTGDRRARLAHATPPTATLGSCPAVLIPLAAEDRSIGLCTDAALYMQLLGAWIVPGDPAAAQDTLQDSYHCLAGQQQEQPAAVNSQYTEAVLTAQPAGARSAGITGAAASTAAAAGAAAVLFLEPLYEAWLQWLHAHPAVVAVYAPNFEQVSWRCKG
jgi:hypothetical protein